MQVFLVDHLNQYSVPTPGCPILTSQGFSAREYYTDTSPLSLAWCLLETFQPIYDLGIILGRQTHQPHYHAPSAAR